VSVRKRTWITAKGVAKEAWVVDYTDQNGNRHLKTYEKKKQADAYHASVRVDESKGTHTLTAACEKAHPLDKDCPIWGVKAIASVIKRSVRQTNHMLERGYLDASKKGRLWVSTPRRLLASIVEPTTGAA
jgi:hypothetical protein